MTCYICAKKNCVDDCQIKMKLNYFVDDTPTNYCAADSMKHLYFKDYKHLKDVDWEDRITLADKIITYVSIVAAFLLILFIA